MINIFKLIIVNLITFTRVVGTFIMPIMSKVLDVYGIIIYLVVLFLTDTLDGFLARKLKCSSIFGALLDAVADKLFGISYLCLIANKYHILFLPVIAEGIIMLINLIGAINGSSIESSYLGKCKTWAFSIFTVLAFIACYASELNLNIFNNTTSIMNVIALTMTTIDIIVAFNYYYKAKREVNIAKENNVKRSNYQIKRGKELVYALFNYEHYIKTLNEPLIVRIGEVKS